MGLGELFSISGSASKTEMSTATPGIYKILFLKNDSTSGSIQFGLNTSVTAGSQITLAPGEAIENFKFELLTRLYYYTTYEAGSPLFRMLASTKRIE